MQIFRFAVTIQTEDGDTRIFAPYNSARFLHDTKEEAEEKAEQIRHFARESTINQIYGKNAFNTISTNMVECWEHGAPVSMTIKK